MKIAITTSSFAQFSDEPLQLLESKGIEVAINPYGRALTEEEAISFLSGCIGVAAGTEPLTEKVMKALPELKVISRCGAGMDSVDLSAAKELDIIVKNTPDGPTRAVAELVLGYALSLLRYVSAMDRDMRSGVWKKRMGFQLQGKKIGIVGFGRIGRSVGELFHCMGCEIAFFDPHVAETSEYKKMELDPMLAWADIVTLHCPAQKGNALLDKKRIASMKKGAWLINAARGGLIDESALYEAIASGALSGAAIDVFTEEPYKGKLMDLPSVIVTPHIGSYAQESRITMEVDTIKNLLESLDSLHA